MAGKHILIVDDHRDVRDVTAEMLRVLGHEVTTAVSVADALRVAEEISAKAGNGCRPIDLVACDLQLPDGSGWDLMPQLAARYNLRGIAVSGHELADDVEQRCREAGFLKQLVKPIDFDQWEQVINETAEANR